MKITKDARKAAKSFFLGCVDKGRLQEDKVRIVVREVLARKPRHYLEILQDFQRLIRLEIARHHAIVESASKLDDSVQDTLRGSLKSKYGDDLTFEFKTVPELIGGLRVRIGSDVFDGSVQARLNHLENELLHA
ncbi:MAG: F0F1 ATP synthase subunit delta [Chthoniobacteraceae bacterium]